LSEPRSAKSFLQTLYFRVLVGIVAGVVVGRFFPNFGASLKPLGDGFLKLIRMLVAPVVFLTVVSGIAKFGDLRRLGRVGLKSLVYFESVTTLALVIGLVTATLVQPGRGINANPASLDTRSIGQYTTGAAHTDATDFLLNIIPDSFIGAFARGEMLQVLLLAVLSGIALATLRGEQKLVGLVDSLSHFFFKLVALVMEAAPLGAFGAMAFTIGRYGVSSLLSMGKLLLCCYATSIGFIIVVLGAICWSNGVSLWRFVVYIREELLIVIGTSSSEPALPRLMLKMENLGCSRAITGLVIPAGYSFNLDGTSIYLTIALLFVAQATNTHLSLRQQIFILFILMLNSKGAATVTGGGLITLAATLSAFGTVPVAGIALLIGVDRFLSEMRSVTNIIGNGVATIVISRWEGQFDVERARAILDGRLTAVEDDVTLREHAGVM
jgi:aerobic C4-dicarboxylate transport protein